MRALTGSELLTETYKEVIKKADHISGVEFLKSIDLTIAADSDECGDRVGFMHYTKGNVIKVDGKEWIISIGKKAGMYPGDKYLNDIIALEWNEGKPEWHQYFYNTLLAVYRNGQITVIEEEPTYFKKKTLFGAIMKSFLKEHEEEIDNLIIMPKEVNGGYVMYDLLSKVEISKKFNYKKGLVKVLSEGIIEALKAVSAVSSLQDNKVKKA